MVRYITTILHPYYGTYTMLQLLYGILYYNNYTIQYIATITQTEPETTYLVQVVD